MKQFVHPQGKTKVVILQIFRQADAVFGGLENEFKV